jgi:hypothetical protein
VSTRGIHVEEGWTPDWVVRRWDNLRRFQQMCAQTHGCPRIGPWVLIPRSWL